MKPGTLVTKIVMIVIALAVAAYLAIYAIRAMTNPFETVVAYPYTLEQSEEVTGYLVRSEQVLSRPGDTSPDLVDILPGEGEKVSVGGMVAKVYQDSSALELQQEIGDLDRELSQVRYIMSRNLQSADTAELDDGIANTIVQLHAQGARNELSGLPAQTEELKNLVYRREYTYSGEDDMDTRADELTAQLKSLRQQAGKSTTAIRASQSGVYSAQVDGYEGLLTPSTLEGLTPSGLEALIERRDLAEDGTALGKLITNSRWYLTMVLEEAQTQRMGANATIRFSRDYTGEITMKVERVSDAENGKVLVVLSSDRYLSETTLLRKQNVDLIYDSVSGLRVPQRSLRILNETRKDKETGEEREVQVTGVYVVTGAQLEWKEVQILEKGDGFYLVKPVDASSSHSLRSGDEVVVRGEDIHDGKVVE